MSKFDVGQSGQGRFSDEKNIYDKFLRTMDKRKVKSQLDERAVQTKVLELRENLIYFKELEK